MHTHKAHKSTKPKCMNHSLATLHSHMPQPCSNNSQAPKCGYIRTNIRPLSPTNHLNLLSININHTVNNHLHSHLIQQHHHYSQCTNQSTDLVTRRKKAQRNSRQRRDCFILHTYILKGSPSLSIQVNQVQNKEREPTLGSP